MAMLKMKMLYYFEAMFGAAVFNVFGVKVAASAYVYSYMEDTFGYSTGYDVLILVIWTATLVSRTIGKLHGWSVISTFLMIRDIR